MMLSVSGLSVKRSGQTILHPTSLEIKSGERIGVVGVSGSGKSTLGHALVDSLRANGRVVSHVPQSPDEALDPLRSMEFHWREAEQALGQRPDKHRKQVLFQALKIETGDRRQRPWGWSRGMQQRFVIAMALIGSPDLLVMDEPTSALDPVVASRTMDLLDRFLANSRSALVMITHDLGMVAQRVNRLLVMHQGQLVEDRETNALIAAPQSQAAAELCAHRSWLQMPC